MTKDFEDIFTEPQIKEEDIITDEDGCMFHFFVNSEFKGNKLTEKVNTPDEFKKLINSLFALGIDMKHHLVKHSKDRYFYPFFSLIKKDSTIIHGTMMPAQKVYSLDSLKNLLKSKNKRNIKEEDLTHILHMIEIKSHACGEKECNCPISVYENKLLIQSFNLKKPKKSLTFTISYMYTEDGVEFDENNIDIIPMEKSIHTGNFKGDEVENNKDLPYN